MTLSPFWYAPTPRVAGDLTGLPFLFISSPETFEVTELPAYEPTGLGCHIYLLITKRDLSSDEFLQVISKATGCPHRDLGTAGRKDKRATTTQWISIPEKYADSLQGFSHPQITVETISRHNNKLGTGHNLGNRFVMRLPWKEPGTATSVWTDELRVKTEAIAAKVRTGILNCYGPQRFGNKGDTANIGFHLLTSQLDQVPRKWMTRSHADLAFSALQSLLFNAYTTLRFNEGTHDHFVSGDFAIKITGAQFAVTEPEVEQPRIAAGEITVAGPMFGKKMREASAQALDYERRTREIVGMDEATIALLKAKLPGTRRALTQRVADLQWAATESGLELTFTLPSGSYATQVVAEFLAETVQLDN